ncbi:hypothetical protein T492DRAFT_125360 [Pavlovales sp. CCMP2436]|nr:hypothetical protein T492DRAFT_125360 [Pavlovales sp. CCMP2436]
MSRCEADAHTGENGKGEGLCVSVWGGGGGCVGGGVESLRICGAGVCPALLFVHGGAATRQQRSCAWVHLVAGDSADSERCASAERGRSGGRASAASAVGVRAPGARACRIVTRGRRSTARPSSTRLPSREGHGCDAIDSSISSRFRFDSGFSRLDGSRPVSKLQFGICSLFLESTEPLSSLLRLAPA